MAAPQDKFYVELGKRLRAARKQRGLTQDQLARALKLTRTSITNIEGGKQPVFAHQLVTFGKTLGVAVEVLLAEPAPITAPKLDATLEKLTLADEQRDWVKRIAKTS